MRKNKKTILLVLLYSFIIFGLAEFIYHLCAGVCEKVEPGTLLLSAESYDDYGDENLWQLLIGRVRQQPFNLVSLTIFILAILHTFLAHYFKTLSRSLRKRNIQQKKEIVDSFAVEILYFLGEVEVVFGIWVLPLIFIMNFFYGWGSTIYYLNHRSYIEPMFVVIIMAIASTRPIVQLAEDALRCVARLGGESVMAWWWVILTIGPLSGSLITEPGAMTISALLLANKIYELKPSPKLAYATLGLLFTNVSVGGVFTNFAAPPVLMISHVWGWDTRHMFFHFGWKAIIGILLANLLFYFVFRKELSLLNNKQKKSISKENRQERPIPLWINIVHIVFLAIVVVHAHYPVIFVGSFLLFLGFYQATLPFQNKLELKPAILVGFFLAGLVVHGTLQAWWIAPMLTRVSDNLLLVLSAFLTSFNDNAEITFLASLVPSFSDTMKYAVLAGAVTGGGLTVIANAPNPGGQAILGKYFPDGISAVNLFLGAIIPTIIIGSCFYLLREF